MPKSKPPCQNCYQILGVVNRASEEEIKRAYRKLTLKFHPDKTQNNPEATAIFLNIQSAFQILSDPTKKKDHDKHLYHECNENEYDAEESVMVVRDNSESNRTTDEILSKLVKVLSHPNRKKNNQKDNQMISKPSPIVKTITVSMNTVWTGGQEPIVIKRWVVNPKTGIKTTEKVTLYVLVHEGVDDNELIWLRDEGHVVSETCKGDVKVFVKIENNTDFKREGLDLYLDKTLSLKEALCGFQFAFSFLDGRNYLIQNVEGNVVSPGWVKTIKGMGLGRMGGATKGNLHIRFHVLFPSSLSLSSVGWLRKVFRLEEGIAAAPPLPKPPICQIGTSISTSTSLRPETHGSTPNSGSIAHAETHSRSNT